jgi:hypothetical protein
VKEFAEMVIDGRALTKIEFSKILTVVPELMDKVIV